MSLKKISIHLLNESKAVATISVEPESFIIHAINKALNISQNEILTKQPYIYFGNDEISFSETFAEKGIDEGARLMIKYPDDTTFPYNIHVLDNMFNQVKPKIDSHVLQSLFMKWHYMKTDFIEEVNEPGISDRMSYLKDIILEKLLDRVMNDYNLKLDDYYQKTNHGIHLILQYMINDVSKSIRGFQSQKISNELRAGYKSKKNKRLKTKKYNKPNKGGVHFSEEISKTNIGKKRDLDNISMSPEENPSKTLADNDMWFNYCVKEVFSKYNIWSREDLEKFKNNPKEWIEQLIIDKVRGELRHIPINHLPRLLHSQRCLCDPDQENESTGEDLFQEIMGNIELCTTNDIAQNENFLDYEVKSKRKTKKKPNRSKSSSYKPWARDSQKNIIPNL